MRKKAIAVLTALAVMALGTTTAFAASPTVGTTEKPVDTQKATTTVSATSTPAEYAAATKVSEGFEVKAVSDQTLESAKVAVQNEILNDIEAIGDKLGDSALAKAAKDSSQRIIASILSVVDVSPTSAKTDANGNYVVTLSISGIAKGDAIVVLHWTGDAWETIIPDAVANGSITFTTGSLSPVAVVKLSANSVTASPKTGETAPYAIMFIVIGAAGAAICGRRYFAA